MRIWTLLLGVCAPLVLAVPAMAAEEAQPLGTTASAPTETQADGSAPLVRDEAGREGRVHTVVRGDTLWDISETYLGSAWVWPTIWKANPDVANPNRIYPGNRIWISSTEMRRLSDDEAEALIQPPAAVEDAAMAPARVQDVPYLDMIALVSVDDFESAGSVLGTPETEEMLAAGRRAYVSFGEGEARVGDRFTVVREAERLTDPETKKTIGVKVDQLGWLEIMRVDAESSEAMIRKSHNEIQVEDRLIPFEEPAREVVVRPGEVQVEGQVAMLPGERKETGQFDLVFLNRGTDHGVDVGHTLEVYRPGKVEKDRETKVKHRLPDDVVANLLVVTADTTSAVALVTHAQLEIERGDHFRGSEAEASSFEAVSSEPLDATQWTARTIEAPKAPPASAAQRLGPAN